MDSKEELSQAVQEMDLLLLTAMACADAAPTIAMAQAEILRRDVMPLAEGDSGCQHPMHVVLHERAAQLVAAAMDAYDAALDFLWQAHLTGQDCQCSCCVMNRMREKASEN